MRIVTSAQNPLIQWAISLRKDKKIRQENNLILVSNDRVIKELSALFPIKTLFYSSEKKPTLPAEETIKIPPRLMKLLTGLKTPQTLAALLPLPSPSSTILTKAQRLLICDRISNPGNLGTLIRTASAFAFDALILLPSCVDPYNEKVLSAAKGANFFLPLLEMSYEKFKEYVVSQQLKIFVADLKGQDVRSVSFPKNFGLLLSHEAQGASPWPQENFFKITLPMKNPAIDSLNVAICGGIFLYLMQKK